MKDERKRGRVGCGCMAAVLLPAVVLFLAGYYLLWPPVKALADAVGSLWTSGQERVEGRWLEWQARSGEIPGENATEAWPEEEAESSSRRLLPVPSIPDPPQIPPRPERESR